MKQINKYATPAEYTAGASGRDANKSAVSQVDQAVVIDGINTIVPATIANCEVGDLLLYDTATGLHVLAKRDTFRESLLPARYIFSGGAFLKHYGEEAVFVSKNNLGNALWAEKTEYKLTPDTTAAGSFDWHSTINNAVKSGSVSWAAGATLASIAAQMNTVVSGIAADHGNYISVAISTYTSGELVIENPVGLVVVDCTTTARVGAAGEQRGTHTNWQTTTVKTLFPDLDYMDASSAAYAKNGFNLSYHTNANLAKAVSYWSTHGVAEFKPESSVDIMSQATWDSLATDSNADHVALYNKYGGSYEAYMAARMWQTLDSRDTNRTCRTAAQGKRYTDALASVVFTSFDGSTKPVYPAAQKAAAHGVATDGVITGFEVGNWHLPTNDEICEMYEDGNLAKINKGFAHCDSHNNLSNDDYTWSCGECNGHYAWCFNGTHGTLYGNIKYNSFQVRPALALKLKS